MDLYISDRILLNSHVWFSSDLIFRLISWTTLEEYLAKQIIVSVFSAVCYNIAKAIKLSYKYIFFKKLLYNY